MNKLIVILGPTAVGKTKLAVQLANELDGEIISADSRQVYKHMDIGTGKDLKDFKLDNQEIPYHLIDIKNPGDEYDVFQFQQDFIKAYTDIRLRNKVVILCGGTGMYLQAAIQKELLFEVPKNEFLRTELKNKSQEALNAILKKLKGNVHNHTDLLDRSRTIRAIEIETYKKDFSKETLLNPVREFMLFGVSLDREIIREQIKRRLDKRLDEGMIGEVEKLIKEGLSIEKLKYYGLEYKYIAMFLNQELSYKEFYDGLLQAIRKFAKRQMTWYRRMEKQGYLIHWVDANEPMETKIKKIKLNLNEKL